ncbi:hypothetical protein CDAR_236251 [Caerostris darwini]|uniref:Glycine-rich protein n=1 Tax=Caerostris darwini TaxID=1538125 RepID=A0AAV4T6N9_9ARAC|nr:hypothetical protein CDAR_236251 [Caerostris darwini]
MVLCRKLASDTQKLLQPTPPLFPSPPFRRFSLRALIRIPLIRTFYCGGGVGSLGDAGDSIERLIGVEDSFCFCVPFDGGVVGTFVRGSKRGKGGGEKGVNNGSRGGPFSNGRRKGD